MTTRATSSLPTEYTGSFIGGEWATTTPERIEVVSPATEDLIGSVPAGGPEEIDLAVAAARRAFDRGVWRETPPAERAQILLRAAALLEGRAEGFAQLICDEVGSPITYSQTRQVPISWMILRYFAGLAGEHGWEEVRRSPAGATLVTRQPVGVVAAIVPWNVPLTLTMAKVAPALLSGCAVVVKAAEEAPLAVFALADVFAEAGLPPGLLNIVAARREPSEHLIRHKSVDKVAFTGSTQAGRRIAEVCGHDLRRVSLELGGKSAAVVLNDADLPACIPQLAKMAMANTGQICHAQTRVLAPKDSYGEVLDLLRETMSLLQLGDPRSPTTEVGPLVSRSQLERVEMLVTSARAEGARVVLGGGRPAAFERGHWFEPTVLADVGAGHEIFHEEVFGPVLTVTPYEDDAHAVALANDSMYGLGGCVWTSDVERGVALAKQIESGTCGVNRYAPDLAAPFGGLKASGIGREFGPEGLDSYLELQSVYLPDT